jgi:hypothetical protein
LASKDNMNPGPTAAGITDADGRYTLIVDKDTPGSVVSSLAAARRLPRNSAVLFRSRPLYGAR